MHCETVSQPPHLCRLPHSLQALDPPAPSDQHWEETHYHHLKGICPNQQPSGLRIHSHTHPHTHTHTHTHNIIQYRINKNIPPNSTKLYLLLHLLLHLLSGSFALQYSALLWRAGQFTLLVFVLRDAVFIQVCYLRRNRESLHAGKPQVIFACILLSTKCSAVKPFFKQTNSYFSQSSTLVTQS